MLTLEKPEKTGLKKATNVTLSIDLLSQAKLFKINVSQVCEAAIKTEVKRQKQEQWLAENEPAIEAYNRVVNRGVFAGIDKVRQKAWANLVKA